MVNIGGLSLDIPWASWMGQFQVFMIYGIGSLIALGLIVWIALGVSKKKTFVTPIKLYRINESNGEVVREIQGIMGGKVKNNKGVWTFKMIFPKQFKKIDLGYMPDFGLQERDGSLCFSALGDSTILQQCTRKVITEEVEIIGLSENEINEYKQKLWAAIENDHKDKSVEDKLEIFNFNLEQFMKENKSIKKINKLLIRPMTNDVKTKTINDLHDARTLFDKPKITVMGMFILGLLILGVMHLISLYLQTKIRCPTP